MSQALHGASENEEWSQPEEVHDTDANIHGGSIQKNWRIGAGNQVN